MIEQEFRHRLSERESRYPGWKALMADCSVHIHVDPGYAATYAGQVAAITAASLFGRMSESVSVDVDSLPVLAPLPWASAKLDEVVMQTLKAADPYGRYEQRPAQIEDLRLVVGPAGDGLVVHGSGWDAYYGKEPSPLSPSDELNPFGSAFAVIAAASRLQQDMQAATIEPVLVDTYSWRAGLPSAGAPTVSPDFDLGELWCMGIGSVGSCALFFLSLITRTFHAVLVDRDTVEIENVRRSALFSSQDALNEEYKVEVARRWLNKVGVERIEPHTAWLDEIPERWRGREPGTPDILISAANERNVRPQIESGFPPLQVYATTGRNWQATLFRHIPLGDACSLCVPGSETPRLPTPCATASPAPASSNAQQDDVALPFLSYAAGLMTAAEIAKLALTGEAATRNRVFFEPQTHGLIRAVGLGKKPGCVCQRRDATLHEETIRGSRFASLSVTRSPEDGVS